MDVQAQQPLEGADSRDGALPLVTVAILSFNRRDALAVNLRKLSESLRYPRERLEIVVVDNASTDGTREMLGEEFPDVQVIANDENEGVPAWNHAFSAGHGDWFLTLDDDCYVEGDLLRRALAEAREHGADLVSFRVESSEPGPAFSEWYQVGVLSFWGCSALISARAIRELGGFDPRIFIWSHELEFTARLLDAGMTHVVIPEVASVHMKALPGLNASSYARTMRSTSYVAARLLRPLDLAGAAVNLVMRPVLGAVLNRELITATPSVVEGLRAGLRVRRPLRPAVSRLYRRNYFEFSSPVREVRGPRQRLHDARSDEPVEERRQLFWKRRRELYPQSVTTPFRVP